MGNSRLDASLFLGVFGLEIESLIIAGLECGVQKLDISLMGAVGNRFSPQRIRIFSSNTIVDLKVNRPLRSGLESSNFGLFLAKTQRCYA